MERERLRHVACRLSFLLECFLTCEDRWVIGNLGNTKSFALISHGRYAEDRARKYSIVRYRFRELLYLRNPFNASYPIPSPGNKMIDIRYTPLPRPYRSY